MSQLPTLCIYHHGCADGVAAAWAVREHFIEHQRAVEFHPGIYGEAPPDVTGRDVILVDFSYKRPELLPLIEQARSVLILDHHKTAQDDLIDLPAKAQTIFDMECSGAMIAWQHFHPHRPAPLLFDHIQDRDLWRFALSGTREITAAVYSYPLLPTNFDNLIFVGTRALFNEGLAILRKQNNDVAAIVRDARRTMKFGDWVVPAANVPWMYASDVAGELAKGHPFAVTYYDDADGRRFSLRSTPDGINVSLIAKALNGGGHEHAAGFRMTREEALDFEIAGGL